MCSYQHVFREDANFWLLILEFRVDASTLLIRFVTFQYCGASFSCQRNLRTSSCSPSVNGTVLVVSNISWLLLWRCSAIGRHSSKKRSIAYSMFLTWKGELLFEGVNPIVVVLHAVLVLVVRA